METAPSSHEKNISTLTHLSTFSKWFIPFGNFVIPILLWSVQKNKSKFADYHGRGVINFQLSVLLYTIGLLILSIPFFIWQALDVISTDSQFYWSGRIHTEGDIAAAGGLFIVAIVVGTIALGLFIFEIICVVSGAMNASRGEEYTYPLTINFIKESTLEDTDNEDSEQENPENVTPQMG